MSPFITTRQLAQQLGLSLRGTRYLLAELEQQGFVLEMGYQGTRLIPKGLANLIAMVRKSGKPLKSLHKHPDARPYLKTANADWLDDLIDLRVQLGLLREIVGTIAKHQQGRVTSADWSELGLPDPRSKL